MADFATRSVGIGYTGGSLILFASLMAVLGLSYWSQGSVSVEPVTTPPQYQIKMLKHLHAFQGHHAAEKLERVQEAAIQNKNIFSELMEASKVCSLGEITKALFEVGGQYRRSM